MATRLRGEAPAVSANGQPKTYAVCVLMEGNNVLLRRADRGLSAGRMVFPGGIVAEKESTTDALITHFREIGVHFLSKDKLSYHGILRLCYGSGPVAHRVGVFSSKNYYIESESFLSSSAEWIDRGHLPVDRMWKDVRLWLPFVYESKKFDITIRYDDVTGSKMSEPEIRDKGRSKPVQ